MFGPHQTLLHAPALVRFVAGLTGLYFAILPAPSPGRAWDIRRLIAGCRAHAQRVAGARRYSRCEACGLTHLRKALAAPRLGHDYEGSCGVRSFLLPVIGVSGPVGLLALRRGPESGRRRERPVGTQDRGRDAAFRRAVRLLRPMAPEPAWRHAGDGCGAETASADVVLGPAGRGARTESVTTPLPCEARSRFTVRELIKRVQCEFTEPLRLKQLARESGLNASYLSTVFAREAGLPFKSYLTALRLEHAQVLLRDLRLPISRVAREVGYASPHRFRAAFRARVGLSPSHWRAEGLVEREK